MTKVSEVIENIGPESRVVIKDMIARAGANGEITIDQLLALYHHSNPNVTRDERLALVTLAYSNSGKFAPKLDFTRRCEVLALHRAGITNEAIAAMYGIDRRTVVHIYTERSPHYKKVREEEIGLGRERFQATYLTQDNLTKALSYKEAKADQEVNNKYANRKAGVHAVKGLMCNHEHHVIIQWHGKNDYGWVPGWYYQDLDGDFPDKWFSCGDESLKTSQSCYTMMLQDITDKTT